MKAKSRIILFFFLFLVSTSVFGLNKETLWSALTFADTPESNVAARSLGLSNPSILEEVLFIKDTEKDNVVGRESAFLLLQECSLQQIISKEYFLLIAFRFLSQIDKLAFPNIVEKERDKFISMIGAYGKDLQSGNFLFSLQESFSVLVLQIDAMYANALISDYGLLNSLRAKIRNAQKLSEKWNTSKAAANLLLAAINEAEAQQGKHLTVEAARIFITFCQRIIKQIEE
ncbi:MAG TPA: hypothetical protein PKM25_05070 [Candidatus Ozemobacteraceae bacterium]|nr:hypothetical protein [Candidatus Ozemobacteraceae bacterium]